MVDPCFSVYHLDRETSAYLETDLVEKSVFRRLFGRRDVDLRSDLVFGICHDLGLVLDRGLCDGAVYTR